MAGALPTISGSGGSNCSFFGIEATLPGEEAAERAQKWFRMEIA
jgi:hypothetical protein